MSEEEFAAFDDKLTIEFKSCTEIDVEIHDAGKATSLGAYAKIKVVLPHFW